MLHGDRKDRIPAGEPVPATGVVEPPASLDADAVVVWHQLAPDLIAKGVLTPWDVPLFGVYCQSIVYAQRAQQLLNASSVLLRGKRGEEAVKNPAVQVFRDMAELALRTGSRFGLTPSDRASLATGDQVRLPGEHLLTQ